MKNCLLCNHGLGDPFYESPSDRSITSLCTFINEKISVYFCDFCSHVQTSPLNNLDAFYDQNYKILINSAEEDQLYQTVGKKKIFRCQHQADTLIKKIKLDRHSRVLDYGCAKGMTSRYVKESVPGFEPFLFDVSRDYIDFWRQFAAEENCATYSPPKAWQGSFDLVMSFFVAEHVADPKSYFASLYNLLKPGGQVYLIVPDVYANNFDLIVAEHVNHFSPISLRFALEQSGFELGEIDTTSHQTAYIVLAKKSPSKPREPKRPPGDEITSLKAKAKSMSADILGMGERIREFENSFRECTFAIYGAGFYGALIASQLKAPEKISYFIDQNPFLHGQLRFNKPVVPPEKALPIDAIYVGLNPQSAKNIISDIPVFKKAEIKYFFL